ncbi:MAG: hypothetical protein QM703_02285 [Gemmatales bacterium]
MVDTNVREGAIARAVHGREPGNPAKADLADADVLAPRNPDGSYAPEAPEFSAALMELGALVCTARNPKCDEAPDHRDVPLAGSRKTRVRRSAAPHPEIEDPHRQARGKLLDVLRGSTGPVERAALDIAWTRDTA